MPDSPPETALGAQWREDAARTQAQALPSGSAVVSCSAPLGTGGLGRHLQEIVDALDRHGQPTLCICRSTRAAVSGSGRTSARHALGLPYLINVLPRLPVRVVAGRPHPGPDGRV